MLVGYTSLVSSNASVAAPLADARICKSPEKRVSSAAPGERGHRRNQGRDWFRIPLSADHVAYTGMRKRSRYGRRQYLGSFAG